MCELDAFVFPGSCSDRPLGMETGEIFDGSITASSEENDTPAKNGRLDYSAGKSWCAGTQDNNPFLQIDLGTNFVLCAVATQGNSQAEEWVETYQLQTSNDGLNWKDYEEEGQVRVRDNIKCSVLHLHQGILCPSPPPHGLHLVPHTHDTIYILLTECEDRTGRISARGLGSTDRAASARSVQERPGVDILPVRPKQTRSIRDLLHDF